MYVNNLVRIGRETDGGYVAVSDKIRSSDQVFSFGIGMDLSFEAHLFEINKKLKFQIFDHTVIKPNKKKVVKIAVKGILSRDHNLLKNFRKFKKQYELLLGSSHHFKNRISGNVWFTYDVAAQDVFSRYPGKRGILKIDIEGSEYRILKDVAESIEKFQLIIIEFHDSDLHIDKIKAFVKSFSKTHKIVHFHANNFAGASADGLPEVFELTIMKVKANTINKYRDKLPLDLIDFPNAPHRPDFQIIWK